MTSLLSAAATSSTRSPFCGDWAYRRRPAAGRARGPAGGAGAAAAARLGVAACRTVARGAREPRDRARSAQGRSPGPPLPLPREAAVERPGTGALLSLSAGAVGRVSYVCALVMAHLLAPEEFGDFAAGQMLLTVVGTVAAALVPLPLAQRGTPAFPALESGTRVCRSRCSCRCRSGARPPWYAAGCPRLRPPGHRARRGRISLAVCALVPVWGWLQGEGRFPRYAGLTVGEVGVRLADRASAPRCWVRAQPAPSPGTPPVRWLCSRSGGPVRRDLRWRPDVLAERSRWEETGQIALVQLVLSILVAADVLAAAFSREPRVRRRRLPGPVHAGKGARLCGRWNRTGRLPAAARRWAGCGEALRGRPHELPPHRAAGRCRPGDGAGSGGGARAPRGVPARARGPSVARRGRVGLVHDDRPGRLLVAAGRERRGRAGLAVAAGLLATGLVAGHALDGVTGSPSAQQCRLRAPARPWPCSLRPSCRRDPPAPRRRTSLRPRSASSCSWRSGRWACCGS